jgi:hypothetical protein
MDTLASCPECGAPALDELTCWDRLGLILAWEGDDPDLAALHFFTVACYNLQHPAQFTDAAIVYLRTGFVDALDQGVSASELRRRAATQFEGAKRVLRPAVERHPELRQWSTTIADVYDAGQPSGAADRVRAWAAAIRKEL